MVYLVRNLPWIARRSRLHLRLHGTAAENGDSTGALEPGWHCSSLARTAAVRIWWWNVMDLNQMVPCFSQQIGIWMSIPKFVYFWLDNPNWLVVSNMFVIFHNIWDNPSHWLILFRGGETTNQQTIVRNCSSFGFTMEDGFSSVFTSQGKLPRIARTRLAEPPEPARPST